MGMGGALMRILITGSSGQIGTNLALRLLDEGHFVFGVDIRPNTWTDRIPTLLEDAGSGLGGQPVTSRHRAVQGASRVPTLTNIVQ